MLKEESKQLSVEIASERWENEGGPSQPELSAVVALYQTQSAVEEAVRALHRAGFELQKLSIIGRNDSAEAAAIGYYVSGDHLKVLGKADAFWNGVWGRLSGSAVFLLPGFGQLLAAGPVVSWIVGALAVPAAAGTLSALGAGLFSLGIPEDSICEYETQLKAGKYVVIAHGALVEVINTREAFAATAHQGVQEHACCA
jgi:hypothetical protein